MRYVRAIDALPTLGGPRDPSWRDPRARSPRTAARVAHARLRAAQAAQRSARLEPGALLRVALSGAEEDAPRRVDRRARLRTGGGHGTPSTDRLRADTGGEPAVHPPDVRGGPVRVGGRQLRRALRVLQPHGHGD